MNLGILEIDHLMTYVKDIGQATVAYERMGFHLTPHSHITSMGIVNRLTLMTERTPGAANFIEMMSVTDANLLPDAMKGALSGAEGIKSMVMSSPDVAAAQRELVKAGYAFGEPRHLRREWALPGEPSVWPEFDVLLPIPAPLSFNVCQYHNLPLYQREDWRSHRNGARSLLACVAVADAPQDCAAYFEALFGCRATKTADGGLATTPSATELVVYEPSAFTARFGLAPPAAPQGAPRYAGMRIGMEKLDALRHCLADGKVPAHDHGDRVVVGPDAACGNVIEFVEMP